MNREEVEDQLESFYMLFEQGWSLPLDSEAGLVFQDLQKRLWELNGGQDTDGTTDTEQQRTGGT